MTTVGSGESMARSFIGFGCVRKTHAVDFVKAVHTPTQALGTKSLRTLLCLK